METTNFAEFFFIFLKKREFFERNLNAALETFKGNLKFRKRILKFCFKNVIFERN